MARDILKLPNVQALPPMFDSGGFYRNLTELRHPADGITVFLSSSSPTRGDSLRAVMKRYGWNPRVIQYDGHNGREKGSTPLEQAVNKTIDTAQRLIQSGYFNRKPGSIPFIVASDSNNHVLNLNGSSHSRLASYRGKPHGMDEFYAHGEEWERAALGQLYLTDVSGYALLVLLPVPILFTTVDCVTMMPVSRHCIWEVFTPVGYERAVSQAHSLGSMPAITRGEIRVTELSGEILVGQTAVDSVYGASQDHFSQLFDTAYSFVSPMLR